MDLIKQFEVDTYMVLNSTDPTDKYVELTLNNGLVVGYVVSNESAECVTVSDDELYQLSDRTIKMTLLNFAFCLTNV